MTAVQSGIKFFRLGRVGGAFPRRLSLSRYTAGAMQDDERTRWGETRSRGLIRYLLFTGVGKAGVVFLAVFGTLDYLTRYGLRDASASHVASRLILWVPGAVVVGLVFAVMMWLIMNQQFNKSDNSGSHS
jgi:hypothetical protein